MRNIIKYIVLVLIINGYLYFSNFASYFLLSTKDDNPRNISEKFVRPFSTEQIVALNGQTDAALAYVNKFRSTNFRRKLQFFHIPKTAGTAIEHAAGASGKKLVWGSCRFNHKRKRSDCMYPSGGEWPEFVGWWHLPTHFFPLSRINPYKNAELFGVIRHPYDRMVSEFYYICTLKVFSWRPDQCDRARLYDEAYMNEWISTKIKQQRRDSGGSYLTDNGHFTPQYDFIFGPNDVRMIDYVLTMDDPHMPLDEQFNRLMDAFGMPDVRLVKYNALGADERNTSSHLDVHNLSKTTIDLIHTLYANDFALVIYDKTQIE